MTYRKPWLALALALSISAARAEDSGSLVIWDCWYDAGRGPAIACRLAVAPDTGGEAQGTQPLPGITASIRSQPASLAGETVLIPLYGPSGDPARMARLARAVMCGPRPGCQVQLSPGPAR